MAPQLARQTRAQSSELRERARKIRLASQDLVRRSRVTRAMITWFRLLRRLRA